MDLQHLRINQHGEATKQGGNSRPFQINDGVRQACLLRPKNGVFLLHLAMSKWRTSAEGRSFGFGLGDGLPPLLDLNFTDDILIFTGSSDEIMTSLDKLGQSSGDAGLNVMSHAQFPLGRFARNNQHIRDKLLEAACSYQPPFAQYQFLKEV